MIPLVTSFAFDDFDGAVIVSSFGRGLWRLPDFLRRSDRGAPSNHSFRQPG